MAEPTLGARKFGKASKPANDRTRLSAEPSELVAVPSDAVRKRLENSRDFLGGL